MYYPAVIKPDGDGWLVRFPDIPEALSAGATHEEAEQLAEEGIPVSPLPFPVSEPGEEN